MTSKHSSLTVKNIKKTEYIIKLDGTNYEEFKDYILKVPRCSLTFEIHGSNIGFINAIRRCNTNELELKYMTVKMEDIDLPYITNIVKDVIIQRLECIPLSQKAPEDIIFYLNVSNDTTEPLHVMSDSIKIHGKKDGKNPYLQNPIKLCTLGVGQYICIDNIHIKLIKGMYNGRVSIGPVSYEIINHDMKISSMVSYPTSFRMFMALNSNFTEDVTLPIKMSIRDLKERIEKIETALSEKESGKSDSFNQYGIYHTTNSGVFQLYVPNESHTIGNLIIHYINYKVSNNKGDNILASYRIHHPSEKNMTINIKHSESKKICIDAIQLIKSDLDLFISFFKNV